MPDEFPVPDGFRLLSSDAIRGGEGVPARIVHPDRALAKTFVPETSMPPGWYQFELAFAPEGLVDVVVQFAFADENVLWLRLPVIARNQFLAHVRLEGTLQRLTLVVSGSGRLNAPALCRWMRIGAGGQLVAAARRGLDIFRRDGFGVVLSGLNYLWRLTRPGSIAISRGSAAAKGEAPYDTWIRIFDEAPERDRARHTERLSSLTPRPLISILTALRPDTTLDVFARGIAEQIYPDWELVVASPADGQSEVGAALAAHGLDIAKLRIVNASGGDLNAALAVAQGEFVLPLAPDIALRPHALLELAMAVGQIPAAVVVYADEDRLDSAGRRSDWRFKPAWSPHWLQGTSYFGHPTLLRRAAVHDIGGWRADTSDAQHDLLLRLASAAEPRAFVHLAKLLAHAGERAPAQFKRPATQRVPDPAPRVSLIVPTRDGADVLATCIRSIRKLTRYPDYEIIVVDNGSVQDDTKRLLAELSADPAIRILPRREPFNFSRLNNAASREATGSILALVNNDIEVTQENWLSEMVALAVQPKTGCVGAKLLYPDGRLQHAGVVIGLGGVAGHAHRFARADDPGYLGRLRSVHEVSAVTAACLVVRREVFDAVGGLDEELTVAFNDVDFCLRVRAAGYLNLWTPFAELIHHESVSRGRDLTPAKAKRFAGEYAAMQRRWGAQLLSDPYYSPHLTYDREDFSLRLR